MGKSLINSEVMQSESFLRLSDSAQMLYVQLLLDADSYGILSNATRSIRAAAKSESDFEALIGAGFVIDLRTEKQVCVIAHYWIMNKWDARNCNTAFAETISGYLCFIGESRLYRLQANAEKIAAPTGEQSHKCIPVWGRISDRLKTDWIQSEISLEPVCNTTQRKECNNNAISKQLIQLNKESPYPAGAAAMPDRCPSCQEPATTTVDGNNWIILCPKCGTTRISKTTGEETQISDKP